MIPNQIPVKGVWSLEYNTSSMYEASSLHVPYLDLDKVLGSLTLTAFGGIFTDNLHIFSVYTWRNNNWQGAGFGGPLVMTLQTNPMFKGP